MCAKVKSKLALYMLSGFVLFGCILISGCFQIFSFKNNHTYKVPQEKFQQIDMLELIEEKETEIEVEKIVNEGRDEKTPAEVKLSLEECRVLTLENNLDLKVQLISPTIAAEGVTQEEARFESVFSATVYNYKFNTPIASDFDELSGYEGKTLHTDLGVNIPFRTGGNIQLNLIDKKKEASNLINNPSFVSSLSASISQPLLRNAGTRANTHGIRLAEYSKQIVDAETKLAVIRILAEVDRAYWRLYATRRLLDVRRQQYDLAKELFKQTERLVDVGINPEIELVRTRAGLAARLEDIITAKNRVRDTERYLKRTLNKAGLGMKNETELILITEPDPVRYEFPKDKTIASALKNRMEMLELELQLARDASTIDYNRNKLLPLVTMQYQYNMNGLGPQRGDSYDLLKDNDYHDQYIGLNVSIPLGNKAAKSQLHQAVYQRAQRLASKESRKAQIEYEVLNQIDQLEASWQHIMASRQTTILRDQEYKAEKRQYELGMQTSRDVLQAQTDLADAQQMEILAVTQYQIALVDLAYATGTLLGATKVELEPIVPN